MPAKAKGFRGHQAADRLVFATCETHCETFTEMDEIAILYKPRCIIGVWVAGDSAVGLEDFIARYCKGLARRTKSGPGMRGRSGCMVIDAARLR